MKKLISLGLLLTFVTSNAFAVDPLAKRIQTNTSNFNGVLTSLDTTVQKALDTFDNILSRANTWLNRQVVEFNSTQSNDTALEVQFNKTALQNNTDYGFSAFYAGVVDSSDTTGEIEDKVLQKSGFDIAVFRSGDSTVNWIDGSETVRGYSSYISDSRTIRGSKHDINLIGHDITVLNGNSYTTEGTHLSNSYGNKIQVSATGTVVIDTFVNRNIYGEYIEASSNNTNGNTNVYGVYIKSAEGGDTNYSIYSETTAPSYLGGPIQANGYKSSDGTSGVTASGTSCTVTQIKNGLITAATCV